MDNFTITTLFTKKDYIKFLYRRVYRNPVIIFVTLVGLFLLVTPVLKIFGLVIYDSKTPYTDLITGLFLILTPIVAVLIIAKGHSSSPSMQHEVTYTFGEEGVFAKGLTFESNLKWAHIIKTKEIKKYLLLYSSTKLVNFIAKDKLSEEEIQFIKSKVKKK
jgi:uncharacterized membrane protein